MLSFKKNTGTLLLLTLLIAGPALAQQPKKVKADAEEIASLKKAVESNLADAAAHAAYIKSVGVEEPALKQQYEAWENANPGQLAIPLAYGTALYSAELPEAKPWLLKVVNKDPKQAKVWQMLSFDAERWGDFAAGRGYMKKASEAEPKSPDYAFYYASSQKTVDSALHHKLMLSIPEKFPGTERGAQALYWLALRSESPKVKTEVYELLKKKYNPEKSGWCSGGMGNYFDFLLKNDAAKALKLSAYMVSFDSMRGRDEWVKKQAITKAIIDARALNKKGKSKEALALLNKFTPVRYSYTKEALLIEKAKFASAAGNNKMAYDSLLVYYATEPTDEIMKLMSGYAKKTGKDKNAIQQDVWELRKAGAKPATVFSLDNYLTPGKTSLADLKGKVVLVTYWFPGCGPCRGEFPHFENVVRKFSKDQIAYIGINMVLDQDPYVVPFMKQSGYSFTPIRDEADKRGNLVAVGAPTNYLIDKEGNIVFRNFRTDERNERTLELMISELLDK